MPKELTHWILADLAMQRLPDSSRIRAVITANRNVYLAGAVLPDTLLYLHKGAYAAAAQSLAHRFHDTCGNSFAPLVRTGRSETGGIPDPLLACLLGVISHMEADIVFHPFVYAMTGTGDIGRHYRLETDIDIHFLQKGVAPPARQLKELMSPETCKTLIKACSLLFDPDGTLPRHAFETALALHCRIQAMYDSSFWKIAAMLLARLGSGYEQKQQLFYPLMGAENKTETLDGCGTWRHPVTGEARNDTLQELVDTSVQKTAGIFQLIEDRGSLADALDGIQGENLLTGLYGICEVAMKTRINMPTGLE